jgi:hypothetical protein
VAANQAAAGLVTKTMGAMHDGDQTLLSQTAFFAPKGLSGLLYWYALYPVHALIFSGLVDQIARRAVTLRLARLDRPKRCGGALLSLQPPWQTSTRPAAL